MASKKIRPIRFEGNVAYVPLTQGYEAIIDAEDASLIGQWNWTACPTDHTIYAQRTDLSTGKRVTVKMHRVLCQTGSKVDHANCNGLDNRKANLRAATNSENCRNARISKRNTSGVKGVSWNPLRSRWEVTLRLDRRVRYFARFASLEDAAAAYARASEELHGKFGRLA